MESKSPEWEVLAPGVRILRLYQTRLNPDWPRVLVLDLTGEKFREFEHDILAFDRKYGVLPDKPIRWVSTCAKPPQVEGMPEPADSCSRTVVILKASGSRAACAASPQETSRSASAGRPGSKGPGRRRKRLG